MNVEHTDALAEVDELDPMDETEIQAEVARLFESARSYQESELDEAREKATDYYMKRPFGDEEAGRSQIVTSDVQDAVLALMPSFMRTFFGPEKAAVFAPNGEEDRLLAEQITDYIHKIVMQKDNNGFLECYSAFKDVAVRRLGVIKWWWDDMTTVEEVSETGLPLEALLLLEADENVEYEVLRQYEYQDPDALAAYSVAQAQYDDLVGQVGIGQAPEPPQPPQVVTLYDVDITRIDPNGRAQFESVPLEEISWTPDSRNMRSAIGLFHRTEKTRSELLAMGIPEDLLADAMSGGTNLDSTGTKLSRAPNSTIPGDDEGSGANVGIQLVEAYVYLDENGDGVAEHRKVRMVGTGLKLVDSEMCRTRPFAFFEIDPEPHEMIGLSVADRTMDLQMVNSHLLRGGLDSLGFTLHPRTVVLEGHVNIKDVMKTEIGALIRERTQGAVRELPHQFVGQSIFPFLERNDMMKQERLGISKAAAGLDPDALQSTTKAAVAATVSGAQQHLDLFTRMLAETGMKPLMKGLLELIIEHQDYARTVRLSGEWVSIDPRVWNSTMDVEVRVAVGFTQTEEKLAALRMIKQDQEAILSMMGMHNPFVTPYQYAETLREITRLSGHEDTARFWNKPEMLQIPPPPEPQPSPEEKLADAQVQKVQMDAEKDKAELQLRAEVEKMKDKRERERIEAEMFLRAREMELKYASQNAKVQAELEKVRSKSDG